MSDPPCPIPPVPPPGDTLSRRRWVRGSLRVGPGANRSVNCLSDHDLRRSKLIVSAGSEIAYSGSVRSVRLSGGSAGVAALIATVLVGATAALPRAASNVVGPEGPRAAAGRSLGQATPNQAPPGQVPRFRTTADLISVTVTVTDEDGRFVTGLTKGDFLISEDDKPQPVTQFIATRVPVSLGIALDTSGSMAGQKMVAAQSALYRFLGDLLVPDDEVFVYRITDQPILVQGWTVDRQRLKEAIRGVPAEGGTALTDTVAVAVPYAEQGSRPRKALVIISDGNDTASSTNSRTLLSFLRETEVLVYAIGIAGRREIVRAPAPREPREPRFPIPMPFPGAGGRRRPGGGGGGFPPSPRPPVGGGPDPGYVVNSSDTLNVSALREFTDASGGRTEVVRSADDLAPATASIAAELDKQYLLGYDAASGHDGRWHTIKVEVKGRGHLTVRARKGYQAASQ